MSMEAYLEFVRAQGRRVIRTKNCWWEEVRRFSYVTAPAGLPVSVQPDDIRQMFTSGKALALRIIDANGHGQLTYRYSCVDPHYSLSSLDSKTRNQTRRGLENCQVELVDFETVGREGLALNLQALSRQGRTGSRYYRDPERWWRYINACANYSGARAYATFYQGKLCAYAITFQIEGHCFIANEMSSTAYLRWYSNNALCYTLTQELLQRPDATEVTYGLEPLSPLPSLEQFKLSMGYTKIPVHQRLVVHPLLRPFLRKETALLVATAAKRFRHDYLEQMAKFLGRYALP